MSPPVPGSTATLSDGPTEDTVRAARPALATRPVRVCLVGPSLDILGGQAVQLQRLLGRLSENPKLQVGFLPVNPRLPGPLRALQRIKYVRTVVTSIAYVWSLLRRARDYDVIHAFSASYASFLLAPVPAMAVAKLFGRRTVLNYRSGEADDHLARSPLAVSLIRKLTDRIVVPSGYLVEVFGRFGLRAESVPNFVEIEKIPYRRRAALAPVFLSNRNLEPMYNVACVLRAFTRIQRAVPDASLTVAGDGRERARLEALATELGLRNVRFLGQVSPREMPALYDAADVYLNAPDIDNMPNSILEAYAAGLPVVTTDAGGIPFITTHERTALLVRRDDDAAMAEGALRLLGDATLAEQLSTEGREECLARYVWPRVGAQWEALYASLAAPDASTPIREF